MQWIFKRKERAALRTQDEILQSIESAVEEVKAAPKAEQKDMDNLENATSVLVAAILDTEEYRTYAAELEKVRKFPEVKAQIDDFRRRNFALQTGTEIDFNKLDEFEKEYQSIRENPLVADFLAAEVDLCKLVQKVHMQLISALDFE